METIKGKGLIAISTVLVAIVWFDISLKELSFYGITFKSVEEWKLLVPLFSIYLLFSFRYLQGFGEMRDEVHKSLVKLLIKKGAFFSQIDRRWEWNENRKSTYNIEGLDSEVTMIGVWDFVLTPDPLGAKADERTIHSIKGASYWFWKYLKFIMSRRAFLNYFLPIPFTLGGLYALRVLLSRLF